MASLNNSAPPRSLPGLANGTGTNGKTSAAQPATRRRIEPVMPLTFLQRRPNSKSLTASTQLPSPLRTSENTPATPVQDDSDRPQLKLKAEPEPEPEPEPEREPEPEPEPEVVTNGTKLEDEALALPRQPEQKDRGVTASEADSSAHHEYQPETAGSQTQGTATPSQTPEETTPPDSAPSAPASASFPPPVSSPPSFNNMRPPFYPASNHLSHPHGPIPEPIRLPTHPLRQPRMHQSHPSNSSLVFGGINGSNTTSPLPYSGGAFPPPMSMAHDQIPVTGVDGLGRPILAPTPLDVQGPVVMNHGNHGPLTPHSLHGSHSSRNEDWGHKVLPVNGVNGVEAGRPGPLPGSNRHSYHPSNPGPFAPDYDTLGEAMGFNDFISSMFSRAEFADCEVVLVMPERLTSVNSHFPGARNGPLRFPAHQVILAQHPLLRSMIQEQQRQADGPCELRIDSDDPFLRADAMWRAVKFLYGCRYAPPPPHLETQPDVERFHFALGYAAAGARLEVPPVSIAAVREASKLLSWDTIEKGLEYTLAGLQIHEQAIHVPHNFPTFRFKHGVYVGEIAEKIVLFLITCFPNSFTLDPTVDDPRYTRLPALVVPSRDQSAPTISPGWSEPNRSSSTVNGGHGGSRMSSINIRFGDMDLTETNAYNQFPAPQQSVELRSALSRMLLNLPFEMLRLVLETNSLGGVSGWQTVQDRRRAMADVVAERESRRLRFLRELVTGGYHGPVPMEGLRSKVPQAMEISWSNVCWKEECVPNAAEGLSINRVWVPVEIA